MPTASIVYQGELHCELTHTRSGQVVSTDAPVDNQGKGEAFSPTDLVAAASLSCMVTTIGIMAAKNGLDLGKVTGTVEKIMTSGPRKISALNAELIFEDHQLDIAEKQLVEQTALNCPVNLSLHNEMTINLKFTYS